MLNRQPGDTPKDSRTTVLSYPANDPAVRTAIGRKRNNLIQVRSGTGFGLFGPYIELPAGRITARVNLLGQCTGHVIFEITADLGKTVLLSREVDLGCLDDNIVELSVVIQRPLLGCEVRMVCQSEDRGHQLSRVLRTPDPDLYADIAGIEIEIERTDHSFGPVADAVVNGAPATREPTLTNPYANRPSFAFWRRAVTGVPSFALDPMVATPFAISGEHKIATAGSCFAQNIARHLSEKGLRYFVTERAPEGTSPSEIAARNFGTFSARYGNVYTARQLLQLFHRAYGQFSPSLSIWSGKGDYLVDPFRPQIQPNGYGTENELLSDRKHHLQCVRQMFEESDVFVFTLGLTEAWISRADGSVIPTAPGVVGGSWNPAEYQFKNFTAAEVIDDLSAFMRAFRSVNPDGRVIFTVSPVPLIATYEDRHVLVSTVYSKSVLRVAAEEVTRSFQGTSYFPSYEIITWKGAGRSYFEDDLRSVTDAGVQHVMRVFFRHYMNNQPSTGGLQIRNLPFQEETLALRQVVCDEEVLDQ